MSYDLVVFEPSKAPRDAEAFDAWFEQQTNWADHRSYDDPAKTSPKLAAWYADMCRDFPDMNGADVEDADDDNARVTGYSLGPDLIYADFRWSEAENALQAVLERAVKHGVGFFNGSTQNAAPWFPPDDRAPDTTIFHGLELELYGMGTFKSPSAALIEAAVDWVTPLGGADFMILQIPGKSYAQAKGGPDEWIAEWRAYSGDSFKHYATGWSFELRGTAAVEELSNSDVKAIMLSFAYDREKPEELKWQDISAEFDNTPSPDVEEPSQSSSTPETASKPWWQFWR